MRVFCFLWISSAEAELFLAFADKRPEVVG
jgi:hypothetical protein